MDEKVLKAEPVLEKFGGSSPKVLKREVFEAARDARDVVAQAQEKAKQIVEEAEHQRDRIFEDARRAGNAEGFAAWNQSLADMTKRADDLARNWEDTMLELSVHIARKIIGEELKLHPDTIVGIVREVIKGTRTGRHLAIQVNEEDAEYVRAKSDLLRQFLGGGAEIEIVTSSRVEPGGCVIESELGIIDARLETQLQCLEDALKRHNPSE
jgi:type III secretion protein L